MTGRVGVTERSVMRNVCDLSEVLRGVDEFGFALTTSYGLVYEGPFRAWSWGDQGSGYAFAFDLPDQAWSVVQADYVARFRREVLGERMAYSSTTKLPLYREINDQDRSSHMSFATLIENDCTKARDAIEKCALHPRWDYTINAIGSVVDFLDVAATFEDGCIVVDLTDIIPKIVADWQAYFRCSIGLSR